MCRRTCFFVLVLMGFTVGSLNASTIEILVNGDPWDGSNVEGSDIVTVTWTDSVPGYGGGSELILNVSMGDYLPGSAWIIEPGWINVVPIGDGFDVYASPPYYSLTPAGDIFGFEFHVPHDITGGTTIMIDPYSGSWKGVYAYVGPGDGLPYVELQTADSITVISPNGGESLLAGSTHTVSWEDSRDGGSCLGTYVVKYSTDGGQSWHFDFTIISGGCSFEWTVPSVVSDQVVVRVCDSADSNFCDISDGTFSIFRNPEQLYVPSQYPTIQAAINDAYDGDTILVDPGLYIEDVDFLGKAITVQSLDEPAVLQSETFYAVSFYHQEGPNSVLKNFIITNSFSGILCVGTSPTISNVTVVDCNSGGFADGSSNPSITNSIFWDNINGDLFGCVALYSIVEDVEPGLDPLFADSNTGDYRLKSQRGRYSRGLDLWVVDVVTSPGIDGGDPAIDPYNEPLFNGDRINIGAYGGTSQASMSNFIVVDDMESYDDSNNYIWDTWIDGCGDIYGFGGNGTGSCIELATDPCQVVHSGSQSMEYFYYHGIHFSGFSKYSEITREYDPPLDWSSNGEKALVIWFHGMADNDSTPMWVYLNND